MFDILWISVSFLCGLLSVIGRLPPLIGYLAAGFILRYSGIESIPGLNELSEVGISLLLFSIGLKLDLKSLGKPEVLGVGISQSIISFAIFFGVLILFLGSEQYIPSGILAFGLTFSSTIFVVKLLEQRGDFTNQYGKISIGVLIIQDIMAVLFIAFTSQKIPSAWLLLLLISLWPLKVLLSYILDRLYQSELIVLFGLTVSFGGAYLFDLVNIKGDLGALIFGILLSKHQRAPQLNRWLLSFKDFFLLGFFLSIGMVGLPTWEQVYMSLIISLFLPLRILIYFFLFNRAKLRNRNSFMAASSLTNFSEFGLIVVSFAVTKDLLGPTWLTTLALTVTFSFVFSAILNRYAEKLYLKYSKKLKRFQRKELHPLERDITFAKSNVLILGMGRVGQGAYESFVETGDGIPIGIDVDESVQKELKKDGIEVLHGNATNPDFWLKVDLKKSKINLILLAMPVVSQNCHAAKFIRSQGYKSEISSIARFSNEETPLKQAGVDHVFNLYAEAGIGFAQSAYWLIKDKKS